MTREVYDPVRNEGIDVAVHMDPAQYVSKISEASGVSRYNVEF